MEIPLEDIRRPLMRTRANDPDTVQELTDSIRVIGLQVPVGIFSFNINFTYQKYFSFSS
uniref:Sulfiredoxin n=1 Tax=Aegilops tauschii subsp. strangulata TaxID=200361 RepID=A0A453QVV0_AEGTS